jgi:hypothetical protein
LDAYEAERQSITEQVSQFAMSHAQQMIKMKKAVPSNIEEMSDVGEALRAQVGRDAYDLNVQQFCCAGLNFGYFYDNSPIIMKDAEQAPAYSMGSFTESTVPGCRAPHFWLDNGKSLYDDFGDGYTLLKFDSDTEVSALENAMSAKQVPLTVLSVEAIKIPVSYTNKFVLCRTDQHIVWRGDALPSDLNKFVGQLTANA